MSASKTPVTPRDAATVMLLRDAPTGLEVFMMVRHDSMRFAAGALVFPGGSVDAADRELAEPTMDAFQVAALRETFEECGILLARAAGGPALVAADRLLRLEAKYRAALTTGELTLAAMLRAEDLTLAADLLVPFAHWITPASQPKRFDTRFYLAAAPPDQLGTHDGQEAVDSLWIAPAQAVTQTAAGRYKLVFATQLNLVKLARHKTVAEALDAARSATIVTVEPKHEKTGADGKRHLRIPAAADYGGEVFEVDLPPASG
jgi:8-oxo-dGTP pyrophosphatase MutT (NUDIX family)